MKMLFLCGAFPKEMEDEILAINSLRNRFYIITMLF